MKVSGANRHWLELKPLPKGISAVNPFTSIAPKGTICKIPAMAENEGEIR
jgi:hypothetical protein